MKPPTQLILTKRLVLRRHRLEDAEAFGDFMTDANATRYMAFTPDQKSRAGARSMIEYVLSAYDGDAPVFSLTIADPQTDAYLGSCGAQPIDEASVEVYVTVMPSHQGEGIGTEAMLALVAHIWKTTDYDRIVGDVVIENKPIIRVLGKCGFVDIGAAEREAAEGDLAHVAMSGRRMALGRPLCDQSSS